MNDRHSTIIEQLALAEFITNGDFARHIRKMRILYHERQQALIFYAQKYLKGALHMEPSHSGLHPVGWLSNHKNDELVSERARKIGVIAPPPFRLTAWRRKYHRDLAWGMRPSLKVR